MGSVANPVGVKAKIVVKPSNTVRLEMNTESWVANTSYKKAKEAIIPYYGKVKCKWEYKARSDQTIYTRIYKNDNPFGDEHSTTSTDWVSVSEVIEVEPGDKIQLYAKTNNELKKSYLRNFHICFDIQEHGLVTVDKGGYIYVD